MSEEKRPGILGSFWLGLTRTFESIRKWLLPRSLGKDPLREFDEVFAPIDLEEAKKTLRLEERAHRFGSKDLPDSRDAYGDGPQSEIRQYVLDSVSAAYRRANRELERLRDAVTGRTIGQLVERARRLPDEVESQMTRERRIVDGRIEEARKELDWAEQRISDYQTTYRVKRDPEPRAGRHRKQLLIGTLSVAFVQVGANMFLFAQGMAWGLAAGVSLAFLLAVLDILLHLMIGQVAGRVRAPDASSRIFGLSFTLLGISTIAVYNLSVVHLRNGIRLRGFAEGLEGFGPSLLGNPFGFTDAYSYMLLAIGLVCSILAFLAGWHWADPIPVFRKEGPRRTAAKEEIEFWTGELAETVVRSREESLAELELLVERISHNLQTTEALVKRMRRLKENLGTFLMGSEDVFGSLILFYRDENKLARSSPPPRYFREEPSLQATAPLEVDPQELDEFLENERQTHKMFLEQLPDIRREVVSRTNPSSASNSNQA